MKKLLLFGSLLALPFAAYGQTYFYDDFNDKDVSNWTRYDVDGDGNQWADIFEVTTTDGTPVTPVSMISRSWQGSPLTPNNWIVSPAIDLTAATGAVNLSWKVQCAAETWDTEKYSVYVSTSSDMATLMASPVTFSEVYDDPANEGTSYLRILDVSSLVGQTIYVAFRHHDVTDQDFISIDDVKVAAPATIAPDCAAPVAPANGSTEVAYNSVNLTWTAPTAGASVDSYDIYLDKNPTPTTLVGNSSGLSFTATNLDASSTYYWQVVPKNTAGSATGCAISSFATSSAIYCSAGATSTSFEKISNVTFADINNNSTSPAGYEDFTQVVGNVTAGETYTFTASFSGNSYSDDQVLVWIDYNNDKDFNDAGEEVLVTPKKASPWTGSITIPANVASGQVRMRVRMHDSSLTPNVTPCGTSSFGQVEDYTLNLTSLAVSNVNKAQVKVYPNPVVDVLNIEADSKVSTVQVFDLTGKVVSSHALNAVKNQVNLSKLTPGVYVVTIQTEKGIQSVKIVKK